MCRERAGVSQCHIRGGDRISVLARGLPASCSPSEPAGRWQNDRDDEPLAAKGTRSVCCEEGSRCWHRFSAIAIAVQASADHVVQQIHRALNEGALYLSFGKLSTPRMANHASVTVANFLQSNHSSS